MDTDINAARERRKKRQNVRYMFRKNILTVVSGFTEASLIHWTRKAGISRLAIKIVARSLWVIREILRGRDRGRARGGGRI
jgi:hypothetical protein